jgi:hypothetical protein
MSRHKEICGCIHIHYPLQKLQETFEPVGKEGNMAGLDFLILNSHTPKKNIRRYEEIFSNERYYGKTLVINSEETDDNNKQNHLLVIGGSKWYGNKDETSQVLFEITRENCLSFIPHPEGIHRLFLLKKKYFWENWEMEGFTGIEIWSMLFDWAKTTRLYNLPVRYLGFPKNLKGPSSSILNRWDALSLRRKVVGIAGLDIHPLPLFFGPFDVKKSFAYHNVFKALRNHILLKEPLNGNSMEDKKKILSGLKKGRLFFANDLIANSYGFYFGTENEEFIMGDTVSTSIPLTVKSPVKAKIMLVFNGAPLWEEEIKLKRFIPANPGVYRIEAKIGNIPWVFTNHIRVI